MKVLNDKNTYRNNILLDTFYMYSSTHSIRTHSWKGKSSTTAGHHHNSRTALALDQSFESLGDANDAESVHCFGKGDSQIRNQNVWNGKLRRIRTECKK